MTTKEVNTLAKRLLPSLPGFAIYKRMMILPPVEHTLRAFYFERSMDAKAFYLTWFFMPLCVPTEYVHFTFGNRIRSGWNADEPNLESSLTSEMQKHVPLLHSLWTPKDIAEALRPKTEGPRTNPHSHENFAYMLIQAGEFEAAGDAIEKLLTLMGETYDWEQEMASRAKLIGAKLLQNPEEAKGQLKLWESETVHNLGLEKFRLSQ
jgi:hypothetical protein